MILVNGIASDALPVDDRGLAYGDGLFETLRSCNGRLPLLDYHLERLYRGLRVLGFKDVARDTLIAELHVAAASVPDGVIKLIITRGSGNRGYAIPAEAETRRIVIAGKLPEHVAAWNENGISLRFCSTVLEGPRALDGLKHLNRLAQVLARAEWHDSDIQEGLVRDAGGNVVEGTMSNLFIVARGRLLAPPVGPGVAGVMRRFVLETATANGMAVEERVVTDAEIESADEIFLTNSVIGICPAVRIGNRTYRIGTMTRQLQSSTRTEFERRACSEN